MIAPVSVAMFVSLSRTGDGRACLVFYDREGANIGRSPLGPEAEVQEALEQARAQLAKQQPNTTNHPEHP